MKSPVNRDDILPFAIYFLVVLLWVAWVAALLNIFHAWFILLISALLSFATWRLLRPRQRGYLDIGGREDRVLFIVVLLLILIVSAMSFYFFHDSLSGTRDEGIYSNNAVYLANNGELPYPQLNNTDTRLFLNTVWNAELYGLFGYTGMRFYNIIPFALALLCVFLMVKDLSGNSWAGLVAVALISLSYPVLWYTRRMVNEIFFFSLFWISVYLFHRCLNYKHTFKTDFTLLALTFPLMAFVRPEGLVVLGIGIIGVLYLFLFRARGKSLYPLTLFVVLILMMSLSLVLGFMHMDKKYEISDLSLSMTGGSSFSAASSLGLVMRTAPANSKCETGSLALLTAGSSTSSSGSEDAIYSQKAAYTTMAMIKFGIMPAILFLLPFFILLFLGRRTRAFAVFLLLLALPFAYFYFKPNIGFDFPWFMRRFVAVFIPLSFIAFSFTIFKLRKIPAIIIAAVYLAVTLFVSAPVILHREYGGTADKVGEIAALLPEENRVLVDRYTLGEYGLSSPLFFAYGRDVLQVQPWDPVSIEEIGEHSTVYLVTNEGDFRDKFFEGLHLFDDTVNIDDISIVGELEVEFTYLQPTCEFHRAGNTNTWVAMDYRIALDNIEVPSRKVTSRYKVLIVRMEIDTAVVDSGEMGAL